MPSKTLIMHTPSQVLVSIAARPAMLLALLILMLSARMGNASVLDDHYSVFNPDGDVAFLFNLPSCLPDCGKDDQVSLTAESPMEREIVAAINNAKKSVLFSQYTFSRRPIYEALVAAYNRGVKVRGAVDKGQLRSIGAFCVGEECPNLPAPFDSVSFLQASSSERLAIASADPVFNQASNSEKLAILLTGLDDSGIRFIGGRRLMHHKFVLIDEELLLSGSGNWSSTAISVNLENLSFSSDKNVVEAFVCIFESMWGDPGQRSLAAANCQKDNIFFSPVRPGSSSVVDEILSAINASQQSIDIAMHHLVHPGVLFDLSKAANRGVKIRIVTDDDLCTQRLSPELAAMIRAGAEIRYIPTTCSIFQLAHNKYAVFDQRKLINGSGNWSLAGLERNYENFVSTSDFIAVDSFQNVFNLMWQQGVDRQSCMCDRSNTTCRERYCLGQR